MTPYYADEQVTIFHADCREVMADVGAGVLITDPPYGIDYEPTRRSNGSKMWGKTRVRGDHEQFNPADLLDLGLPSILWGANNYAQALPPSAGWLVWDKTPKGIREGFIYSHAELAWTNFATRVHKFALEWQGADRNGEQFLHPTQKPLALMRWCIGLAPGGVILDPFLGSGSTLRAAKDLGRRAIGVEIEERFCEVAARRMAQEVLAL